MIRCCMLLLMVSVGRIFNFYFGDYFVSSDPSVIALILLTSSTALHCREQCRRIRKDNHSAHSYADSAGHGGI